MADGKHSLKIDKEKCKGCSFCIMVCPQKALELSGSVNKTGRQYIVMKTQDKCTGCGLCFTVCPDCAIEITEVKREEQ